MSSGRVLVALSGGVDSSVAAHLLKEQGWDVVGAFLRNGVEAPVGSCRPRQGCCSADDARDAALIADQLEIPFHSLDMEVEFQSIQDYFRSEYEAGRTPNPCAACNRDIKFGALEKFADAIGADYLATGHYARIRHGESGVELLRGIDQHKDQSYVLFPVPERILARTLLPIGELDKSETRAIAARNNMRVSCKPDSQEICFVPTGNYRDFLEQNGGLGAPGLLVDTGGKTIGQHLGYMGFTRGQRRGLGIAWSEPLYVVDIIPETATVVLGTREELGSPYAEVVNFHTWGCQLAEGEVWSKVAVQYRSAPGAVPAQVKGLGGGRAEVIFSAPANSLNPGQGIAVYRGDRMLGGGWIERTSYPSVQLES